MVRPFKQLLDLIKCYFTTDKEYYIFFKTNDLMTGVALRADARALFQEIESRTSTVCVLGLGQVGIPTALSLIKIGFKVIGYDVNKELVSDLKRGICRIPEHGFGELISDYVKSGLFVPTFDKDALSKANVVIICVPTPLDDRTKKPDLTFLQNALKIVASNLDKEKLIVLESTIPPRTMTDLVIPTLETTSRKKAGIDFLISFCPERIAPGKALEEFSNNARIIGANDEESSYASFLLFKDVTKGEIYLTDTNAAEISKLAENSYRDVNIAFANELAILCEKYGTDVEEVIRLANTHPRVHIHNPGPGVGGPCLPKDPYLLISGVEIEKSVVKAARLLNDSMPQHVVNIVLEMIARKPSRPRDTTVLILGTSYKGDVNDTRYSPTEAIVSHLSTEGFARIFVHDPYSNESFGAIYTADLSSALSSADYVIIATAHSIYKFLKVTDFKPGSTIIDSVRILDRQVFENKVISYTALGSPMEKMNNRLDHTPESVRSVDDIANKIKGRYEVRRKKLQKISRNPSLA